MKNLRENQARQADYKAALHTVEAIWGRRVTDDALMQDTVFVVEIASLALRFHTQRRFLEPDKPLPRDFLKWEIAARKRAAH
jgi:hypothetical protein